MAKSRSIPERPQRKSKLLTPEQAAKLSVRDFVTQILIAEYGPGTNGKHDLRLEDLIAARDAEVMSEPVKYEKAAQLKTIELTREFETLKTDLNLMITKHTEEITRMGKKQVTLANERDEAIAAVKNLEKKLAEERLARSVQLSLAQPITELQVPDEGSLKLTISETPEEAEKLSEALASMTASSAVPHKRTSWWRRLFASKTVKKQRCSTCKKEVES